MERYAIIIKTDGVCVLLHCYPGDCLSLEEMQKIVEGHIQAVPTALAQGVEPGVWRRPRSYRQRGRKATEPAGQSDGDRFVGCLQ